MCFCFNYFDCGFYRKIPIFYNHGIIELKCFQCEVWWSVWKLVPTHQTEPSLFWEVAFNLDSAGIPPSIFYFLFCFFLDESGYSDEWHLCFSHSHETRRSFTRISSLHFIAFFFCIALTEQHISSVSSWKIDLWLCSNCMQASLQSRMALMDKWQSNCAHSQEQTPGLPDPRVLHIRPQQLEDRNCSHSLRQPNQFFLQWIEVDSHLLLWQSILDSSLEHMSSVYFFFFFEVEYKEKNSVNKTSQPFYSWFFF